MEKITKIMKGNTELTSESRVSRIIATDQAIQAHEVVRQNNEIGRQDNEEIRQEFYNAYKVFEDYNPSHNYVVANKVFYQGSTYQCKVDTIGNAPTGTYMENTWWKCIAVKGVDGDGSGDMTKLVYDPTNRSEDIFALIDEASNKADLAFQSASDGKTTISNAITGKDSSVVIPPNPTFAQLADAIDDIKTGGKVQNLVLNGSFENSMDWFINPNPSSGNLNITTTEHMDRTRSIYGELDYSNVAKRSAWFYQIFQLFSGHKYYISCYVKTSSVYTANQLPRISLQSSPNITAILPSANTNWTLISALGTATTTGNNRVHLGVTSTISSGVGTYFMDSVMVIDLTSGFGAGNEPTKEVMDNLVSSGWWGNDSNLSIRDATITADTVFAGRFGYNNKGYVYGNYTPTTINLIRNGNFSDSINDWNTVTSNLSVDSSSGTNKGVILAYSSQGRAYQNIVVKPNHIYYYACEISAINTSDLPISVEVVVTTSEADYIANVDIEFTETEELQNINNIFTVPTNATGVAKFNITDTRTTGFTNITFNKVIVIDLTEMLGSSLAETVSAFDVNDMLLIRSGGWVDSSLDILTNDGNVDSTKMIYGYSGYSKGKRVNGSIQIRGGERYTGWQQAYYYAPSVSGRMNFRIPLGAYLTGTSEQQNWLGVFYEDANAVPANISNTKSIGGIVGTAPRYVNKTIPSPVMSTTTSITRDLNTSSAGGSAGSYVEMGITLLSTELSSIKTAVIRVTIDGIQWHGIVTANDNTIHWKEAGNIVVSNGYMCMKGSGTIISGRNIYVPTFATSSSQITSGSVSVEAIESV